MKQRKTFRVQVKKGMKQKKGGMPTKRAGAVGEVVAKARRRANQSGLGPEKHHGKTPYMLWPPDQNCETVQILGVDVHPEPAVGTRLRIAIMTDGLPKGARVGFAKSGFPDDVTNEVVRSSSTEMVVDHTFTTKGKYKVYVGLPRKEWAVYDGITVL